MPNLLPADVTPNTMLVASLILVVLLLGVFFRKAVRAERTAALAERRAEAEAERVAELQAEVERREPVADRDDVLRLLDDLPRALRIADGAETRREIGDALGAGIGRLLDPEQWMVFVDVVGDGRQYALVAAGSRDGDTWPVGACLTPQMGRVGLVVRRKRGMDRTDFLAEPPIVRSQVDASEPGAFQVDVAVPILAKQRVVGVLTVGGSRLPTDVTRAVLALFGERAALLHRLATVRQRATQLENLDADTDLHNRNWFVAQGAELIFQNRDQMVPIACAVLGVDDFAIYTEREGPTRARQLLRSVASVVRPLFREGDLVCRWGVDEIAVLLPNMERGSACGLLDRLRHEVARTHFEGAENQPEGAVTVSVGIAMAPGDGQSFDELVDVAYRAYRTSRRRGGDRTSGEVEVSPELLDAVAGLADAPPMRSAGPGSIDDA